MSIGSTQPYPSSIFYLVHSLHSTITDSIDTSLTWDQLNSPTLNYSLLRPLVDRFAPKLQDKKPNVTSAEEAAVGGRRSGRELGLNVPDVERRGGVGKRSGSGAVDEDEEEVEQMGLGAVLYAIMANRIQFISLANANLSYSPLQTTRAAFCELLAMKILRNFPNTADEVEVVNELVKTFCAFEGAPEETWAGIGEDRKEIENSKTSALELAIISSAKNFLSLPLIQLLISKIYAGELIYTPISSRGLISDSYVSERNRLRRRPSNSSLQPPHLSTESQINHHRHERYVDVENLSEVYLYDPFKAGFLDYQRLKVPKWRRYLDFMSFSILIALFVATLAAKDDNGQITIAEVVFFFYTLGFILDEFAASKEHGWTVYVANAWNAFDMAYIAIFLLYIFLRIFALATHSPELSNLSFDILACGACVLFPRLVFFLIKDNVVVLALKEMITTFVGFMGLTTVAFSGICFCLWTLGRATWTVKQIVWLMLQIWFGSSYLGFQASASFHPLFGPIVLISYAALCNTLLITILISILSNKFAAINQNAQKEHLFQMVVSTVEGVKSDAVFSYLPPVNLVALLVLLPLSWTCSPRTLHRVNVFFIRLMNFPFLFIISAYERYIFKKRQGSLQLNGSISRIEHIQRPSMFDSFLGGGSEIIIRSVFDAIPPPTEPVSTGTITPPRVSTVTATDEDILKSPKARPAKRTFDSPLAKIFGRSQGVTLPRQSIRNAGISGNGAAVESKTMESDDGTNTVLEVEALKKELREVRESQLRMEELLSKVFAPAK